MSMNAELASTCCCANQGSIDGWVASRDWNTMEHPCFHRCAASSNKRRFRLHACPRHTHTRAQVQTLIDMLTRPFASAFEPPSPACYSV